MGKSSHFDGRRGFAQLRVLVLAGTVGLLLILATSAATAQDGLPNLSDDPSSALPDPGTAGEQFAKENDFDTQYTPVAKDGVRIGWTQIAGAVHPDAAAPDGHTSREAYERTVQNDPDGGEPIPVTVDFYTVSFLNEHLGLAGGAQCIEDPPPPPPGATPEQADQALELFLHGDEDSPGCVRAPVIYRFSDDGPDGSLWEEAYKGQGQGYVGAISWLRNSDVRKFGQRALAVGGDGRYVRREEVGMPDEEKIYASGCEEQARASVRAENPPSAVGYRQALSDCEDRWRRSHDPAGMGRAWVLSDGSWREQAIGSRAEPGDALARIRGMTALDASPRSDDCRADGEPARRECAQAGGLQQIWMWMDGRFEVLPWEPPIGADDPDSESDDTRPVVGRGGAPCSNTWECEWHFRVRAIKFGPRAGDGVRSAWSGCCSLHRGLDVPLVRELDTVSGRLLNGQPVLNSAPRASLSLADSAYALSFGLQVTVSGAVNPLVSTLASPGGPQRAVEPPSEIRRGEGEGRDEPLRFSLTSARFVAGDGDILKTQPDFYTQSGLVGLRDSTTGGDGVMDWAVGGFKLNRQAAAFTTTTTRRGLAGLRGLDVPYPLSCELPGVPNQGWVLGFGWGPDTTPPDRVLSECQVDPSAADRATSSLYRLSPYSLNGFDTIDSSGTSWAVGDRGGIAVLNGGGTGETLPPEVAPNLGPRRTGPAPSREPYEASGPRPSGHAGLVPPVTSHEPQERDEPELVPYGSPNPHADKLGRESIQQIAMSRDGTEGWAIGPLNQGDATTLYRFDGTRWRRCRTDSVEGILAADPECEAVWLLRHAKTPVRLTAIARVPTELGSDPTRVDDFEAIAAGRGDAYRLTSGRTVSNLILRYRDARWFVDETATEELAGIQGSSTNVFTEIALPAPDEAWFTTNSLNSGGSVYRYDGQRWIQCAASMGGQNASPGLVDRDHCSDHNGLFPKDDLDAGNGGIHITSAGNRLYMYGNRAASAIDPSGGTGFGLVPQLLNGLPYPFVFWRDPGPCERDGDRSGCWQQAYDPGCAQRDPQSGECVPSEDASRRGVIYSLSVALGPDGSYNGWGAGQFGADVPAFGNVSPRLNKGPDETPLIRIDDRSEGDSFEPVQVDDAANDYLLPSKTTQWILDPSRGMHIVALPGRNGQGPVVVTPDRTAGRARSAAVWFDPDRGAWRTLPAPFLQVWGSDLQEQANIHAIAPDNTGGFWIATGSFGAGVGERASFYRFTDHVPPDLFEDLVHPVREQITAAAGGPDGSFWVATNTDAIYRYDRRTGWDRMRVPGWDPGVVTRASEARAIAIGPSGEGLVVGRQGRIAVVGPGGAALDAAAGLVCSESQSAPCGSGRTLRSVGIATGGAAPGSALVGGDGRALLYRPGPNGAFRAVSPPPTAVFAAITGISYPSSERAYVVTGTGEIYSGNPASGAWTREDETPLGKSLSLDENQVQQPLNAISIDASGHGYAVGDGGTILERTGSDEAPWRRVDAGYLDDLNSVSIGPGGNGALIGGESGLILTLSDGQLEPVRFPHRFHPMSFGSGNATSRTVGVALLPGYVDGQVEAWAASQVPSSVFNRNPAPGALLHYTNDPSEPLLDGGIGRAGALPDVTERRSEEISFATFGRSECPDRFGGVLCPELTGSNEANDVIARGVRDHLLTRSPADAVDFAIFNGDVGDAAGRRRNDLLTTPADGSYVHRRWAELIAQPLLEQQIPVFGALGRRDLSNAGTCQIPLVQSYCASTHPAKTGPNLAWRHAFARMPAPWGSEEVESKNGMRFEAVAGAGVENPDVPISDPTGTFPNQTLRTGGARTHYAYDAVMDGKRVLRVAVLDSSLDSLAASNAQQNPTEEQLSWLREVLFSRPDGERAVVVTNTPTYSFGPGAISDTAPDGSVLESLLIAANVDLVVSGRVGWNAVYWALAPGLHCPEPGAAQPDPNQPPSVATCGGQVGSNADDPSQEAQRQLGGVIGGEVGADPLPFVIASSAGGRFGPEGNATGPAANGFWHGYTKIRIDPGSDHPPVIEQRPVFDWVGIRVPPDARTAATHVLRPNQRLKLEGFGRELTGIDVPFRYDEITSHAITHRYELLVADPAKPWLPKEDAGSSDNDAEHASAFSKEIEEEDPCGPYLCLDPRVGTIDDTTGEVKAGSGNQSRTFAIAQLSADDHSATYPLVFEPRSSFRAAPISPVPPITVPPPNAPSAPPQPNTPSLNLPAAPVLPVLVAQAPGPPPVPPAPPVVASQSPIDLSIAPATIDVLPPSAVTQPPTPPVNPAPPSGARREARQRQAAAQRSGADSDSEVEATDLADKPPSAYGTAEMSRNPLEASRAARGRPQPSITPLSASDQSQWAQGALYGGSITLLALVLALGFTHGRPTPRRRRPEVPAPAWNRRQR